jgi:hypothetical protein
MKKIISLFLLSILFCQSVLAQNACDWSQIKKLPDGGFEYNPALNLCVGNLVQQNKVLNEEVADLNKAIQLKDLSIKNSDARIALWQTTVNNQQDRLDKMDSENKTNSWIYFGLGCLTVIGTGFVTARLIGK